MISTLFWSAVWLRLPDQQHQQLKYFQRLDISPDGSPDGNFTFV
jgi:hypothetical protein